MVCRAMNALSIKRRARFVGAAILVSLSASVGYAEPPRHDALKMRNAPRASAALTTLSQTPEVKPQPAPVEAAPVAAVDPATVNKATKEATEVLELCYELARRSDTSLSAPVTVHASVRTGGEVSLRTQDRNLGNGYFARCVERKLTTLVSASQLPETDANTRVIVLGNSPVATR